MRVRRWIVCGSGLAVVASLAVWGCSSTSTAYPENVCGSPTSCPSSLAPTPSEIDACTTLIKDETCGDAFKSMKECVTYGAKCTTSGSYDQSATNADCTKEISAYAACKQSQPIDGGPPPVDGCRPRTCAQASASCGEIDNGCGGKLSCGTCTNGQTCGAMTPNRCGCACDPSWCGTLSACGTTITCPTSCPATQTCGGGGVANRCGCLPNGSTAKTFSMSVTTATSSFDGGAPVSWGSASNARTSDNSNATATMIAGSVTQYLVALTFGFALPSTAIIEGIQVSVERSSSLGLATTDQAVYLVKNTAIQMAGDNKADLVTAWPSSESTITYGGATDKWGSTWTAAEIASAGFGVAFAARYTGQTGTEQARVDSISVTIYYSGIVCQ